MEVTMVTSIKLRTFRIYKYKLFIWFFFSSAKKEGKVPDKGGHAVGLERYEILCRMEGKV